MIDMKEYQEKMQAQLDQWQSQINQWQAQAKEAQADAAVEYGKQVDKLKAQHEDMQSNLAKAQTASVEAWNDFKTGADKAWDEMSKAMTEAMKRFS